MIRVCGCLKERHCTCVDTCQSKVNNYVSATPALKHLTLRLPTYCASKLYRFLM